MRLSDRIVLGSTQVKLNPKIWLENNCGCLLGMALQAVGFDKAVMYEFNTEELAALRKDSKAAIIEEVPEFKWLRNELKVPEVLRQYTPANALTGLEIISLFAYAVEAKNATFNQAIEWIRSVEPPDEGVQISQKENTSEIKELQLQSQ